MRVKPAKHSAIGSDAARLILLSERLIKNASLIRSADANTNTNVLSLETVVCPAT